MTWRLKTVELRVIDEGEKNYSKPYKKKETSKVVYMPKRGKLAPLMSEEEKQSAGIHELSYDFGSDADFLSKMSIAYKEAD